MVSYFVQCDESHPVCESKRHSRPTHTDNLIDLTGCKKGGRDCVYPETSTSSKSPTNKTGSSKDAHSRTRESPDSLSDEYEEEGDNERLEPIQDGDEEDKYTYDAGDSFKPIAQRGGASHIISGQTAMFRKQSETPSSIQDKMTSPSPSTEGSVGHAAYQTVDGSRHMKVGISSPSNSDILRSDWSHLPHDLQLYLAYFCENVTYLHYSVKADPGDFLKTVFIDAALRNDALLHAVVGFAAFQRTLHNPHGKIQDFLQYYNKAVSLLLSSLKRGEKHTTGTLLAILQLATIEVSFRGIGGTN